MTNPGKRLSAVDIARALAIGGVVFNHTIDGLLGAGVVPRGSSLAEVNDYLYLFRMPALVLIVGLFIPSGIAKRGVFGYAVTRARLLMYLYVIWYFIQSVVELATSGVKNSERSVGQLLEVWSPPAHLWFLPFLALATAGVAIVLGLDGSLRRLALLGFVALGVALWGWNPAIVGLRGICLVTFLAAGAAIGLAVARRFYELSWPILLAGGLIGVGLLLYLGGTSVPGTLASDPDLMDRVRSVGAAAGGCAAILVVAGFISLVPRLSAPLELVGRRFTLEIYLAHVIAAAGTRIVLMGLGVQSMWVLLPMCLIAGLGAPILLALIAPKVRMGWLFELPGRDDRASATSVTS